MKHESGIDVPTSFLSEYGDEGMRGCLLITHFLCYLRYRYHLIIASEMRGDMYRG